MSSQPVIRKWPVGIIMTFWQEFGRRVISSNLLCTVPPLLCSPKLACMQADLWYIGCKKVSQSKVSRKKPPLLCSSPKLGCMQADFWYSGCKKVSQREVSRKKCQKTPPLLCSPKLGCNACKQISDISAAKRDKWLACCTNDSSLPFNRNHDITFLLLFNHIHDITSKAFQSYP